MSTTIEMLRAQCRIDIDDTTEDEVLTLYYGAARRKAESFINRHLYEEVPETDPDGLVIADDILLALMLLVGHWYENREESSDAAKTSIPFGFTSLIEPYRYIPL
ncbi:head-tail connector protein [Klebsiella pneumoniae]|nr:phage gp6-like head-tail connector protein [Klebsiella pneumoniae]